MRYDEENHEPDPIRCIALSLALIYYFRLPTKEDNEQRDDHSTPSREELGKLLSQSIPDFVETIQNELAKFVNTDNFVIPHGVAVNQAVSLLFYSVSCVPIPLFSLGSRAYLFHYCQYCYSNTIMYYWCTR